MIFMALVLKCGICLMAFKKITFLEHSQLIVAFMLLVVYGAYGNLTSSFSCGVLDCSEVAYGHLGGVWGERERQPVRCGLGGEGK